MLTSKFSLLHRVVQLSMLMLLLIRSTFSFYFNLEEINCMSQ